MQQGRHLQLVCAPLDARRGVQAARHMGGEGSGVLLHGLQGVFIARRPQRGMVMHGGGRRSTSPNTQSSTRFSIP